MNKNLHLKAEFKNQSIITKLIYEDDYVYNKNDIINIEMLSNILINKNYQLFNQIYQSNLYNFEEIYYLLKIIYEEGEQYLIFAETLLKKYTLNNEQMIYLFKKGIVSNSINLLELLITKGLKGINTEIIWESILKNPNKKILIFLLNKFKINLYFNENLLIQIIEYDDIELLNFVLENLSIKINLSYLLDIAIKKNSYTIIELLLEKIEKYETKNLHDEFIDWVNFLNGSSIDYIIKFLSKLDDVYIIGINNLESILLYITDHNEFKKISDKFLFSDKKIKNKELINKIKKYQLEANLSNNLMNKINSKVIKI